MPRRQLQQQQISRSCRYIPYRIRKRPPEIQLNPSLCRERTMDTYIKYILNQELSRRYSLPKISGLTFLGMKLTNIFENCVMDPIWLWKISVVVSWVFNLKLTKMMVPVRVFGWPMPILEFIWGNMWGTLESRTADRHWRWIRQWHSTPRQQWWKVPILHYDA